MNWEAIGAIGEVSGALAVVLTLLYLARQISESRKATIAEIYHLSAVLGVRPTRERARQGAIG